MDEGWNLNSGRRRQVSCEKIEPALNYGAGVDHDADGSGERHSRQGHRIEGRIREAAPCRDVGNGLDGLPDSMFVSAIAILSKVKC